MNWELWDRGIVSPTSKDCQTVTNAIVNASELLERQKYKIFLKQVDKNELQLAMYNNLWTYFICNYMKDKAFLEIRMNNLNNIKLVFATTLCSYLIFAIFNETLLMRPAPLLTLVSNYLNRQKYCHYNAYFRSHFSSRVVSLWSLTSRDHTLDPNRMFLS